MGHLNINFNHSAYSLGANRLELVAYLSASMDLIILKRSLKRQLTLSENISSIHVMNASYF